MKQNQKSAKPVSGFTLIELIVVIAIVSVLLAIFIPTLNGMMEKAFNAADAANARAICTAIKGECMTSDAFYNFTKNPWKEGVNSDGSSYAADDHGYVYVDKNEVRVSSYSLAKLLEEHHFITSAGPKGKEIQEYKYPASQCSRMLCKSNVTWYRYQVNIYERDGFVEFSYSACSRATQRQNDTGMSSNGNKIDNVATEKFADRAGGEPDYKTSLG